MKNPDRRTFLSLGVGALAVAAVPASLRGRRVQLVRRRIPVMGTIAEVAIPTRDQGWAQPVIDAAFAELRRVEATMSRFRDDSDVGRLNVAGPGWVPVSQDVGTVLVAARSWAARSGGSFDPCLGRLTRLWDEAVPGHTPSPAQARWLEAGRRTPESGVAGVQGSWRSLEVELTHSGARARLSSSSVAVDLGGIAKGFAVDAAAEALRRHGVVDGLVNVGGDLVGLGSDVSGEPWLIGVRAPDDPEGLAGTLEVTDAAVATSGDYVRYFEAGGRRHHHLLDPETGAPKATAVRSLTVRARRCIDADAAATALFGASERTARDIVGDGPRGVDVIHKIEEVRA